MRISEKSIELNFCASMARHSRRPLFWFGLTQKQEAIAGFDVATQVGGRVVLFQVKASNHIMKRNGARQFRAPHSQLEALQQRVGSRRRSIYYLLPDFGDTADLPGLGDPLSGMWVLDVADLPDPMPPPTKGKTNHPRKSGLHYLDLKPPQVTIHSEPRVVSVQNVGEGLSTILREGAGLRPPEGLDSWDEESVTDIGRLFSGRAVGVVLP